MINRKYSLDEDYFSTIDSETKAYWLGMLASDGSVRFRKGGTCGEFRLGLMRADEGHLTKFKEQLKYGGDIHPEGDMSVLSICSAKMCRDLVLLGIVPRKSFTKVAYIPNIETSFIPHFLRGVVDGDGWISIYPRKNRPSLMFELGFSNGNESFLEEIKSFINAALNVERGSVRPIKSIYRLTYSGCRSACNVAELLYENASIYLDRKFNHYLRMKDYLV